MDALYKLCYICVVDEYQHWVYRNPQSSEDGRDEKWVSLYSKYLPEVNFDGIEQFNKTRWYIQRHIFIAPFYYIDYALAEVAAMQLAMLADKDHPTTIKKYLQLCKLGGTKTFLDTLKFANLRSPFDEKLIAEVVKYAQNHLP